MSQFVLTGHYSSDSVSSVQKQLSGFLGIVDDRGYFEGELFGEESSDSNQVIRGFWSCGYKGRSLKFGSFSRGGNLTTKVYELFGSAKSRAESIEGEYVGRSSVLPREVEYDADNDIYMERLALKLALKQDYMTLMLTRTSESVATLQRLCL